MTMKPHRIEATDDDVAAVAENRTLAYVHVLPSFRLATIPTVQSILSR